MLGSYFKKAERRKKREQKILPSPLESDTEGYLTPGTFLKSAVLKTAQAEVATSLLQNNTLPSEFKKFSAAERDVEDFRSIAEKKRTQAREASLAVKIAKTKTASVKGNIEQVGSAHAIAEEAWTATVTAYHAAIEKAITAAVDTRELTMAEEEATAHLLYLHSVAHEVDASKLEQTSPFINEMSLPEAKALELAWNEAQQSYQEAIEKAQAAALNNEAKEWSEDLTNAKKRKDFWTDITICQDKKQLELDDLKIEFENIKTSIENQDKVLSIFKFPKIKLIDFCRYFIGYPTYYNSLQDIIKRLKRPKRIRKK